METAKAMGQDLGQEAVATEVVVMVVAEEVMEVKAVQGNAPVEAVAQLMAH